MSAFGLLAVEAVQDAIRRRIAFAVAALCLLSLLVIDSCTSCAGGEILVNGEPRQLAEVAGVAGLVTFATLALWIVVLAGVLAADHLQQTLEDGSASLTLARPVARSTFALSRLAGVLALAGGAGVLLLGAAAFLLSSRGELPLAPVLGAGIACLAGALVAASLSMTLSLLLPRLACVLVVFASVGTLALANGVAFATETTGGILGALDGFGPPLLSSVVLALASWAPQIELPGDPLLVGLRLAVWVVLGVAALLLAFRRVELGR